MSHPLDSARERLRRAHENIRNLDTEVSVFLKEFPRARFKGRDATFTEKDRQAFDVIRKQVLAGTALPRFSVLAGEIVHHLRSAFDHVIWQLSTPETRERNPNSIEFPVFETLPRESARYTRKVQGVMSRTALARIEDLQPYKQTNPQKSPLLLIHNLDRFDKHRQLNIVIPRVAARITGQAFQSVRTVRDSASGGVRLLGPSGPHRLDVNGELFAELAFAEFNERQTEPLLPFLERLAQFAFDSVESFASEFSPGRTS